MQTLLNDEWKKTLDESSTIPQLIDDKGLEILIIATLALLKRKNKKSGLEEVLSKFHQKPVSQEKTVMDILVKWFQINQWSIVQSTIENA